MSEPILMALVQLFAIIAASARKTSSGNARRILESYLDQHLNAGELDEYLKLYDELLLFHQPEDDQSDVTDTIAKTESICLRLKKQLTSSDRIIVFIKFLEFTRELAEVQPENEQAASHTFSGFLEVFRNTFNLPDQEFEEAHLFITEPGSAGHAPGNKLIICENAAGTPAGAHHMGRDHLAGSIVILFIPSERMLLGRYLGRDQLFLNGHVIQPFRSFVLDNGSIIKNPKITPVYYSDVAACFFQPAAKVNIEFTAREVEFRFKNDVTGLHPFSFTARSGELIGVMGGSGVGKSTLLNVLNGTLPLHGGEILVNGYDLNHDRDQLRGVIGFVPQDDLLIEELTVFRNLYFNARLCFRNYSKKQLIRAVMRVLMDIGLIGIRNLTVGDPINKFISGGQRKRLNIALELIRQPSILFADEPTSGLSSMDSEMVMLLLKEQTLKGRLVIVNIHQPSSDIFKLFDKLLIMDKGGYPIFYGNPIDALSYFKTASNHVNPDESECQQCGYVNPEQLLQITEAKIVNEYGRFTGNRKTSPAEWYQRFRKTIQPRLEIRKEKHEIPASAFKVPGLFRQFRIFALRNLLTKITNRQYLAINLLEAPFLAALLAYLTRYRFGEEYFFGENKNLVAYLFMSVVVSLFLGMMVSAEEIIRDRRLLKREAFLNLSRFSYLNSKIILLFGLSAIQAILYVVTGNLILGIGGMTLSFWLIIFATNCFANMAGLNISSGLDSVVAIYILIPFIIVPQLLLSGTVVPFDNLNPAIASREHVPAIGNMMTSRWTFEALAVEQFRNNRWERQFFDYDKAISRDKYLTAYVIPALQSSLDEISRNKARNINVEQSVALLKTLDHEIRLMQSESGINPSFSLLKISPGAMDDSTMSRTRQYLGNLSMWFSSRLNATVARRDRKYHALVQQYGEEELYRIKQTSHNENLADLVLNVTAENKLIRGDGKLIRKYEPVYMDPESQAGNAHLYAPYKRIGQMKTDTFWFNFAVIWLMTLFLYLTLLHDTIRKTIVIFRNFRFRKPSSGRSS